MSKQIIIPVIILTALIFGGGGFYPHTNITR